MTFDRPRRFPAEPARHNLVGDAGAGEEVAVGRNDATRDGEMLAALADKLPQHRHRRARHRRAGWGDWQGGRRPLRRMRCPAVERRRRPDGLSPALDGGYGRARADGESSVHDMVVGHAGQRAGRWPALLALRPRRPPYRRDLSDRHADRQRDRVLRHRLLRRPDRTRRPHLRRHGRAPVRDDRNLRRLHDLLLVQPADPQSRAGRRMDARGP